jgi:hypothetical protein
LNFFEIDGREILMAENWIRANEVKDVTGSIRHVIRTARFLNEDPDAWKWVTLALHSALQGACVCHLTTTAVPVGAVTESNTRKWLAYFEKVRTDPNAKAPQTYLMPLPGLLEAVRKPYSAGDRSNAAGIAISDSELAWLLRIHEQLRNQFVHFGPMGWSIEVSGIPDVAKLIARIIGDMLSIGWAFRHMEIDEREEMQRSLRTLALIEWPVQED